METEYEGWRITDRGQNVEILNVDVPYPLVSLLHVPYEAFKRHVEAKRDEELGRWRDPVMPDYVVYDARRYPGWPIEARCIVLWEPGGGTAAYDKDGKFISSIVRYAGHGVGPMLDVVGRYLEAHPDPKPDWLADDVILISWDSGSYLTQIAQRDTKGSLGWWTTSGDGTYGWHKEKELIELVGDAEVTIIQRKEFA